MGNCLPKMPKMSRESFSCFRRIRKCSHKEAQAHGSSSADAKDNVYEADLTSSGDICYVTINHGVKRKPTKTNSKPSMTNSKSDTEYAFINMPAKKVTSISFQDNNEYDYVLIS